MDTNSIIAALFGAGGLGAIGGLITFIQALRKGKLENEENLIARYNTDSKQQGERADKAEQALYDERRRWETELVNMRRQRDKARDRAAELRRLLIDNGVANPPTIDDLYTEGTATP